MLACYCRQAVASFGLKTAGKRSVWPTLAPRRTYAIGGPNAHEKPLPFQLEHVQRRLTETLPIFFRQHMDFTFYHENVVCEDYIFQTKKIGLDNVRRHIGMIAGTCKILFPHVHMTVVSILPVLEDGTVRVRWRMEYISFYRLLFNPRLWFFDYRIKNLSWFDGFSVFTLDGNGDVVKFTIQRMRRDDSLLQEESAINKLKKMMNVMPQQQNKGAPSVNMTSFVDSEAQRRQHQGSESGTSNKS
ncbi:hypothetical protein WR25_03622 [Diploscapter pachys]|uniref:Uncharacterized protein n=1 Tax=Diploscapter pachys TaxID=2018661 RepID=A0A2A2J291_9BILA|nr:hypothetical protein WR25_03622 [Diploscapter pachys]